MLTERFRRTPGGPVSFAEGAAHAPHAAAARLSSEPPVRRCDLDALRTRVANHAASLAETVTDGFEGYAIGVGAWGVELMAPDGVSTRNGVLARLTIRLVPQKPGYSAVVVGTVDPVRALGEVRTFEHVAIAHELRFGMPLPISPAEYADFLAKLAVLFNLARVRSVRVPPHPDRVAEHIARIAVHRPSGVAGAVGGWLALVVVIALASFVVFRLLHA
jgi:hypothetical protein